MSTIYGLPRSSLESLSPSEVRRHLHSLGWQIDPERSFDVGEVYIRPDIDGAALLLPTQRQLSDFVERMAQLVMAVAEADGRRPWDVLNDLHNPDGDVFRFRIDARHARFGSVPLDEGIKLFNSTRDALKAAANSAHKKQPVYSRLFDETRNFLNFCRLGQTEVGSFVVSCIVPVDSLARMPRNLSLLPADSPEAPWLMLLGEPFHRQVTVYLMNALGQIKDAAKRREPDRIVDQLPDGVSANLCEAVVAMQPATATAKLEVQVRWSASRGEKPDFVPRRVEFSAGDFEQIREIGARLRGKPERDPGRVEGFVHEVSRGGSIEEGKRGTVTIRRTDSDKGRLYKIQLGDHDFALACDAIKVGRKVLILGEIVRARGVRYPEIQHYRLFKPL